MQMIYIFGPLFGGIVAGILGGINERNHFEKAYEYLEIDTK